MKTALTVFAALLFMSACALVPGTCEVSGSGEAAEFHSEESEAAALIPEDGRAAALLPEEGRVAGWKADGEVLLYSADDLWEYINGSAETFLMYDFAGVAVKHYVNGSGSEIKIEIYEHGSPLMAFGIFSQYRSHDAGSLGFGNESVRGRVHPAFLERPLLREGLRLRRGAGSRGGDEAIRAGGRVGDRRCGIDSGGGISLPRRGVDREQRNLRDGRGHGQRQPAPRLRGLVRRGRRREDLSFHAR